MAEQVAEHAAGAPAEKAGVLSAHRTYLIATAGRAPSVHNSQPWQFRVGPDVAELWCDPRRRTGTDPGGREMLISCGAALFGLRLAVRSLGYRPVVALLPDPALLRLVARVGVGGAAPMNALEQRELEALPHRHTHRGEFTADPLPARLLSGLQNDALAEGAQLALVADGLPYDRLVRIAASAATKGNLDPRAQATIRRWTRVAASTARDGVPAFAITGAARSARPARPVRLTPPKPGRLPQRDFDLGRKLGTLAPGSAPPAATAVLFTKGDRRADWLRAGQALHRLLLHAASYWVFASLHTQPTEDPVTRALIRDHLNLPGYPQVILQFGRSAIAAATPRRPPGELLL